MTNQRHLIIRRRARVPTDARGRTIWATPIEEIEIELMSSQELELALYDSDSVDQKSIRDSSQVWTGMPQLVRQASTGPKISRQVNRHSGLPRIGMRCVTNCCFSFDVGNDRLSNKQQTLMAGSILINWHFIIDFQFWFPYYCPFEGLLIGEADIV